MCRLLILTLTNSNTTCQNVQVADFNFNKQQHNNNVKMCRLLILTLTNSNTTTCQNVQVADFNFNKKQHNNNVKMCRLLILTLTNSNTTTCQNVQVANYNRTLGLTLWPQKYPRIECMYNTLSVFCCYFCSKIICIHHNTLLAPIPIEYLEFVTSGS